MKVFDKVFQKLDNLLKESKTGYFMDSKQYSMVDLYGFPHISRIFYLKGSALDSMY